MSLCVALIRRNELYMAGDSRVSAIINGTKLKWHDNCTKIEKIDDCVIFKSGQITEMNNVVERFRNSETRSLDLYRAISIDENKKYLSKNNDDVDEFAVNSLLGIYDKVLDKPILYYCGAKTNFDLLTIEPTGEEEVLDITLGIRNLEARDKYLELKDEINFDDVYDVIAKYKMIYNSVVDAHIGGLLSVYHITRDKTECYQCILDEPDNINTLEDYLKNNNFSYTYIDENNLKIHGLSYMKELYVGDEEINALIGSAINASVLTYEQANETIPDSAIASLSANKITAGTINATISMAGPYFNIYNGCTQRGYISNIGVGGEPGFTIAPVPGNYLQLGTENANTGVILQGKIDFGIDNDTTIDLTNVTNITWGNNKPTAIAVFG